MRFEGVSTVEQRLDMVLARERDGLTVREICALWSVSPDTYYRWLHRYEAEGVAGLEDRSSRPEHSPGQISWALESKIVALRRAHPRWGPRRIAAELRRGGNPKPPVRSTIERVLHRNGLLAELPPKEPSSSRRFERARPNELWQTDVKDWPLPDGMVARIYSCIDDRSRLCAAVRAYPEETTANAIALFDRACKRWGEPQEVLSDRGAIFTGITYGTVSWFERHLWQRGISTTNGRPYHPQTQGKIERYHRTLTEWLVDHPTDTLAALNRSLARFAEHYNVERPHQALDDHTPVEVWNATPRAVAEPDADPGRRQRETVRSTASNGNFAYAEWLIALGRDWASTKIRVLDTGDQIHCYAADGQLIRSVTPDPTRYYLGTGKTRGRPRKAT